MQHYTIFFNIFIALHVSWGFLRPSSGAQELYTQCLVCARACLLLPLAVAVSKHSTFVQNVQTESRTHAVSVLGVLPPSLKWPEREVENSTSVKSRGSEFVNLELCCPEMPSRHALGRIYVYTTTFPLYPSIAANFPLHIFHWLCILQDFMPTVCANTV
jgi:hypothetical protein